MIISSFIYPGVKILNTINNQTNTVTNFTQLKDEKKKTNWTCSKELANKPISQIVAKILRKFIMKGKTPPHKNVVAMKTKENVVKLHYLIRFW